MTRLAFASLSLFILLSTALGAGAQSPTPGTGTPVSAGDQITVSGGGWKPGTTVTISGCGIDEVSAPVGEGGDFSIPVTLPEDAEEGSCTIAIEGTGLDDQPRTVQQQLTVGGGGQVQPSPSPQQTPAGQQQEQQEPQEEQQEPQGQQQQVADTGLETTTGIALAIALILFGAGALVTSSGLRRSRP